MKYYVLVLCHRVGVTDFEFLVTLKNKPENQAGRLNLLGGKVESGETPEAAAIRELKEESGLDATHVVLTGEIHDWDDSLEGDDVCSSIIYCYNAFVDGTAPLVPRPEETEPIMWMKASDILNDPRLMTNLRIIIPMMYLGTTGWIIEDNDTFGGTRQSFRVRLQNLDA